MPINHHEHQVYGEGLTRTASGETLISVQRLAKEVGKSEEEVEAALRSGLLSARKIRDFSGNSVEAINLVSARLHFDLSDQMTQRLYRPDTEDVSAERLKVLWPDSLPQPEAMASNSVATDPPSSQQRAAKLRATRHEQQQLTAKRKR